MITDNMQGQCLLHLKPANWLQLFAKPANTCVKAYAVVLLLLLLFKKVCLETYLWARVLGNINMQLCPPHRCWHITKQLAFHTGVHDATVNDGLCHDYMLSNVMCIAVHTPHLCCIVIELPGSLCKWNQCCRYGHSLHLASAANNQQY